MEAPHLNDIQKQFAGQGLRVLAVNAWDEPRSKIKDFADENKLCYQILLEGKQVFKGAYRGKYVPHTYIINRKGNIIYSKIDWDDRIQEEVIHKIESALGK